MTHLKTYLELGYEHGVDDVLNNPNGINSSRIILGQISPMTSIVEFISNLENSSSFIRITSSNGRVMYDCNPEQLSSLNRRYVGTGFIVEYIVDGIVRDTVYLSVLGDLSGDGNMNATDLNGLTEYVKEPYDLEDEYLLSILIRNNGTVSATDLNIITEAIIEDSDLDGYFYVKPTVDDEAEGQLSRNNESRIIEESSCEIVINEKETNNFEVINDSYILDDVTNDNESLTSQFPKKVLIIS